MLDVNNKVLLSLKKADFNEKGSMSDEFASSSEQILRNVPL